MQKSAGSPESPGFDSSPPGAHRPPFNEIDEDYSTDVRGRQPALSPRGTPVTPGKAAGVAKTLKSQVAELELRNKALTEELR